MYARFSGQGRQLLHIYTFLESISYIKLDHTLYSIKYGIYFELSTMRMLCEGDIPAADFSCCMSDEIDHRF